MSPIGDSGTEEEDFLVLDGEPPATIGGRYHVRRRLEREGGGLVVLADDDDTGKTVVIDFVDVASGTDDEALVRLRESAAATLVLQDPAVLHTTDFVRQKDRIGVVSEYVVGNDLAGLLRRGPLAPSEAARIGGALAQALASMHHAGIAHGLLTPRDVVMDASGVVFVANTALGATGVIAPAPVTVAVYGAPEKLAGEPGNSAADVYSLGVLLYEMVVGHPPFSDWDPVVLTERKLHEPAPVPSEAGAVVPRDYDALVARLLDPRAVARPTADESAAALRLLVTPMVARPPTPMRRRRLVRVVAAEGEASRRRALAWWASAAAVLAVGVVVLLFVLLSDNGSERAIVPSVANRPAVIAIARLQNQGFRVSTLEAPNNVVPAGVVVDQSPAAGRSVKRHAAVVLTVSTGPTTATPVPPPVIIQPSVDSTTSTSTPTTSTSTRPLTTTVPPSVPTPT